MLGGLLQFGGLLRLFFSARPKEAFRFEPVFYRRHAFTAALFPQFVSNGSDVVQCVSLVVHVSHCEYHFLSVLTSKTSAARKRKCKEVLRPKRKEPARMGATPASRVHLTRRMGRMWAEFTEVGDLRVLGRDRRGREAWNCTWSAELTSVLRRRLHRPSR